MSFSIGFSVFRKEGSGGLALSIAPTPMTKESYATLGRASQVTSKEMNLSWVLKENELFHKPCEIARGTSPSRVRRRVQLTGKIPNDT